MDWYSYIIGVLTVPAVVGVLGGAYLVNELFLERRRRLADRLWQAEERVASRSAGG